MSLRLQGTLAHPHTHPGEGISPATVLGEEVEKGDRSKTV